MVSTLRFTARVLPLLAITLLVPVGSPGLHAQESADSLRAELTRLAALVDSLSREVARLRSQGEPEQAEDALSALRAAAAAAATAGGATPPGEAAGEQEFVGRQRSLQSLNPEISLNATGFGFVDQDDTRTDNFFMREFELSIISNLDPYSRAKIFLARHDEGGEFAPFAGEEGHEDEHGDEHGGGFAVEEGYVEWVGIPGGVGLKFGRFFHQFGQLNRWHSHALPTQSRSLPHLAFLGPESLAGTGTSLHWLLPFGAGRGTYETTWEFARKENHGLFGEANGLSVLGNFNAFWNLSDATDLDLSFSWIGGEYAEEEETMRRNLFGIETAVTWRPPGRSRYRGATIRGGLMVLDGLIAHEGEELATDRAMGYWSSTEVRLDQNWLIGARLDHTENPHDPDETAWLFSPTLTWWQSEYVRLRLEYDLLGRSFQTGREGRLYLQANFSMGPHKHETY